MGLGHNKFWATNTGDESGRILLTAWIPEKREDGHYYWPPHTALGGDMWVDNCLDLKEEEGTVCVEIIRSDKDTGLWMLCEDGDFIGETWIYNFKPKFTDDSPTQYGWKFDHKYHNELQEKDPNVDPFGIHANTFFEMKSGDGPWPVTLVRTTSDEIDRKWEERYDRYHHPVTSRLERLIKKIFKK